MLVIAGICLFLFGQVQTWNQIDKYLNLNSDIYLLRLLNYLLSCGINFYIKHGPSSRVKCD